MFYEIKLKVEKENSKGEMKEVIELHHRCSTVRRGREKRT